MSCWRNKSIKDYSAFDETTYTGYHVVTNASGQTPATGNYHFRADLNGTQFWNSTENNCDPNAACPATAITITKPVTITVNGLKGHSVKIGGLYTDIGLNCITDASGQVAFSLSNGTYRFCNGMGRISRQSKSTPEHFLGDALGSVRQRHLENWRGDVDASHSPYGEVNQLDYIRSTSGMCQ